MKRLTIITIVVALVAPALFADSHVPAKNTHAAIKSYVQAAAKYVGKHGPVCDEFAKKDWRSGDYYIFVDDPDNKTLCHPNASLIGTNSDTIIDANGKNIGQAVRAAAAQKGGGWAEYMWPRPGTDKPVQKSTYVVKVKAPDGKTYVVGSGGYELK